MTTQNRLTKFKETYDEAIECINHYLANTNEPEMQMITEWLINTDENPYGFLMYNASLFYTAEGFSSLLNTIHHALYDDGEITFLTVNDEPRLVFIDYDDTYKHLVLNEAELEEEKNGFNFYVVNKLNGISEFISSFDIFHKKQAQLEFENDSWAEGKEAAIEKHKDNKYFNPAWANTVIMTESSEI